MLFFSSSGESYIQYEIPSRRNSSSGSLTRGRTFAKLLGNGLTTTNLTDPLEQPCPSDDLPGPAPDTVSSGGRHGTGRSDATRKTKGTWHQATNSLRLILCNRGDAHCRPTAENTVFFALIHRKFPNELDLPLRYERFFIVWSATPPFGMLAISSHPVLLFNETATGWSAAHNWAEGAGEGEAEESEDTGRTNFAKRGFDNSTTTPYFSHHQSNPHPTGEKEPKKLWAYFTYTVSMAYAYGRPPAAAVVAGEGEDEGERARVNVGDEAEDMHVGYLDDEVVLGIGVDDGGQAFASVKAKDLVSCMRACPGRTDVRGKPQQQQQQQRGNG